MCISLWVIDTVVHWFDAPPIHTHCVYVLYISLSFKWYSHYNVCVCNFIYLEVCDISEFSVQRNVGNVPEGVFLLHRLGNWLPYPTYGSPLQDLCGCWLHLCPTDFSFFLSSVACLYPSYMYGLSNPSYIRHFNCSIGPQVFTYFRIYPSDLQILGVETVS
jgi:hypothetical protein